MSCCLARTFIELLSDLTPMGSKDDPWVLGTPLRVGSRFSEDFQQFLSRVAVESQQIHGRFSADSQQIPDFQEIFSIHLSHRSLRD